MFGGRTVARGAACWVSERGPSICRLLRWLRALSALVALFLCMVVAHTLNVPAVRGIAAVSSVSNGESPAVYSRRLWCSFHPPVACLCDVFAGRIGVNDRSAKPQDHSTGGERWAAMTGTDPEKRRKIRKGHGKTFAIPSGRSRKPAFIVFITRQLGT